MSKKLSIIIPCFNCAKTLALAVESCYTQGFSTDEFEIILVDDASTDDTRDVCAKLIQTKTNIRAIFHKTNRGGGAARNTAVEAAVADSIFCLDSDDLLPPHTLDVLYAFLIQKNADGVGVARSTKFKNDNPNDVAYVTNFAHVGEQISLENLLQLDNAWCSLYSVFMFTKSAFAKAGGYPTEHGFDTQGFAWRFLAAGLRAYTCPNTNYLHRVHHNHSYYLREYDSGRTNANWQRILLEHEHLFTEEARGTVHGHKVIDFTYNLFEEFRNKERVFLPEPQRRYGMSNLHPIVPDHKIVSRNSLHGVFFRIAARVRAMIAPDSWLYDLLVSTVMAKDDIKARLMSPRALPLVMAYINLRRRRLLKHGFVSHCRKESTPIDIVIPTVGKDKRLLESYVEHLRLHLCETIGSMYVVAPNTDSGLIDFCTAHGLTFVDEKSVLGYGKEAITYEVNSIDRRGWLLQQLLKLSGDKIVSNNHYIIVDSDTILIAPTQFRHNGNQVLYENTEWNQPYFEAFKKLFGYNAKHNLSFTSHMMLFSVEKLALMKQEIESQHGTSWDKAYITACDTSKSSGISDYDTYGQWLFANFPHEVETRPLYNKACKRTMFSKIPELTTRYKGKLNSLSFHSYN